MKITKYGVIVAGISANHIYVVNLIPTDNKVYKI